MPYPWRCPILGAVLSSTRASARLGGVTAHTRGYSVVLSKIVDHARKGDLVKVARTKLRHMTVGNRGAGDTYYGDQAERYEANRVGKQYWDDQQEIAEELIAGLPDGLSVLDVPFGTGRFVKAYNRKGWRVSGVEISADMIASARRLRGEAMAGYDVRVGDALELPWPDNTFDLVMSFRFLSEIVSVAEARSAMAEMARVTRDLAILDLGIRDPDAPQLDRLPRDTERSGVAFTEDQMARMLRIAGFEIESITPQYASGDGHRCAVVCRKTAGVA